MTYIVYGLYSEKYNKIYIGQTSNLEKRLEYHNELSEKGWTKKFRPWQVIYKENLETRSLALKREKELKSAKGRSFIRNKITSRGGSPPVGG